jgi:hypothetical protein
MVPLARDVALRLDSMTLRPRAGSHGQLRKSRSSCLPRTLKQRVRALVCPLPSRDRVSADVRFLPSRRQMPGRTLRLAVLTLRQGLGPVSAHGTVTTTFARVRVALTRRFDLVMIHGLTPRPAHVAPPVSKIRARRPHDVICRTNADSWCTSLNTDNQYAASGDTLL